jgi:hypothetical protein
MNVSLPMLNMENMISTKTVHYVHLSKRNSIVNLLLGGNALYYFSRSSDLDGWLLN